VSSVMNATLTMASRIAIDIGVDADEGELGHVDSGLLPDFATAGRCDGFADLHEAAWQRMFPRAGFVPAANQQHAAQRIEYDTVVASAGVRGKVMWSLIEPLSSQNVSGEAKRIGSILRLRRLVNSHPCQRVWT
jgi:hypothetical protein